MSEFVQEKEAEESYAVRKKKELKKAKIQMKKNNEAVLGGVFNRHQRWFDDVTQNQEIIHNGLKLGGYIRKYFDNVWTKIKHFGVKDDMTLEAKGELEGYINLFATQMAFVDERIKETLGIPKHGRISPGFGKPKANKVIHDKWTMIVNKYSDEIKELKDQYSLSLMVSKIGFEDDKKKSSKKGGRKKKTRKKSTKKMNLSASDYRKILKFYKLSIPKKVSNLRKKGDKIIAKKFCSCIKKVRAKFKKEGIAIAICTKSVITRKGIKRGKFKCKKRRSIKLFKGGTKRRTKKN